MTRRYCGRITIYLRFDDADDCYRGRCVANGQSHAIAVWASAFASIARDCPKAFDDAAHAMLSLAIHDIGFNPEAEDFLTPAAATTDVGWAIRRMKEPS